MLPSTLPRRVRVVGVSGAGRTTLAREAEVRLGVTHLELDEVLRLPGRQLRDLDDGVRELGERLARSPDGRVASGDDASRVGPLLDDADLVVWLDQPWWLVTTRIVRRTLVRAW
jgi:adenylate kinase family enzyme